MLNSRANIEVNREVPSQNGLASLSGPKQLDDLLVKPIANYNCTVFGLGNYGLAITKILSWGRSKQDSPDIWVYVRDRDVAEHINREHYHPTKLSHIILPDFVRATSDPDRAFKDVDVAFLGLPSQQLKDVMHLFRSVPSDMTFVSLMKGLITDPEIASTAMTPLQYMRRKHAGPQSLAVLSGPGFAKHIVQEDQQTRLISASDSELVAKQVAALFSDDRIIVHSSKDPTGVEVTGAMKNAVAVAYGIWLGLLAQKAVAPHELSAAYVQGFREMRRVVKGMGASESTAQGLCGLGDLELTCTSMDLVDLNKEPELKRHVYRRIGEVAQVPVSRNVQFGLHLGKGEPVRHVVDTYKLTAEGHFAVKAVFELAKHFDIHVPMLAMARDVINGLDPQAALESYRKMVRSEHGSEEKPRRKHSVV